MNNVMSQESKSVSKPQSTALIAALKELTSLSLRAL